MIITINLFLVLIRPSLTSVPLILGGTGNIPPATAVNFVPWAIVGFIFQYVIRRHHFSWWAKYNCASHVYILGSFPFITVLF